MYDPPRSFHSFWAESIVRWSENGRSPRKNTWPLARRTWLVSLILARLEPTVVRWWASLTTWQRGPHTVVWPLSDWSGWILIKPAARQHWLNHSCRRTDKNWQKLSFNYHQIPSLSVLLFMPRHLITVILALANKVDTDHMSQNILSDQSL